MGEVADLRSTREAGLEAVDTRIAFESFFEDGKDRLLRILSVITGSTAEAEDLAQEAFTTISIDQAREVVDALVQADVIAPIDDIRLGFSF